jgi:hypothetical protein
MVGSKGILGAGGGLSAGLLLLIGGLVVKQAQAHTLAECSTGLGQFGQVLNPNAANKCNTAQGLSDMATVAIWIGVVVLAIAVGGLVALLIASGARAGSKRPKTVVPGMAAPRPAAGPAVPVRPQPAGGVALRPIVPVIVGQEDSAPADDGRRDVFATEPAVSGSSSEITAVLPIFAPAEPFDLAVPARVPDRPSERSLAGVATGPQARLADHPAPPASPVGLADRPGPPVPQARLADRPAPPVPPLGVADRPGAPAPPAGLADYPAPPPPLARSADRPSAPRRVNSRPPWEWADPPPVPGSTVSPAPPWAQTDPPPAAPEQNAHPGPPWAQTGPPPAAPQENAHPGPPWGQTERPPLARQEDGSSGPPWDRAEHRPAPGGAQPDADSAGLRHSGRHRSRRP